MRDLIKHDALLWLVVFQQLWLVYFDPCWSASCFIRSRMTSRPHCLRKTSSMQSKRHDLHHTWLHRDTNEKLSFYCYSPRWITTTFSTNKCILDSEPARFANLAALLGPSCWLKWWNALSSNLSSKSPRCADQTYLDISARKSLVFNFVPDDATVKLFLNVYHLLKCHGKNWRNYIFEFTGPNLLIQTAIRHLFKEINFFQALIVHWSQLLSYFWEGNYCFFTRHPDVIVRCL